MWSTLAIGQTTNHADPEWKAGLQPFVFLPDATNDPEFGGLDLHTDICAIKKRGRGVPKL